MIPDQFHSFETEAEFNSCCDCGCELLISAQTYMIQKSFSRGECVLEFALCYSCKEKLDQQISAESKEAIYDFLFDNSDILEQPQAEYTHDEAMQQIDVCLTCRKNRTECEGYTYSALFVGTHLVTGPVPMMICEECQGELAENLSEHTKNVKDKFYADNFPGPPSQADLPSKKHLFL